MRDSYHQAVWVLKMRALTLQVYVDDIEGEEEGIAETLLDSYAISSMPRPGTSLKNPGTSLTGQGVRPKSQSGLSQVHLKIPILCLKVPF